VKEGRGSGSVAKGISVQVQPKEYLILLLSRQVSENESCILP